MDPGVFGLRRGAGSDVFKAMSRNMFDDTNVVALHACAAEVKVFAYHAIVPLANKGVGLAAVAHYQQVLLFGVCTDILLAAPR